MVYDSKSKMITPKWYPAAAWKKHFALLPVYIDGKWYWFTHVYKRYRYYRGGSDIEFGTILNVLKDNNAQI
jgi:hypothetical protein